MILEYTLNNNITCYFEFLPLEQSNRQINPQQQRQYGELQKRTTINVTATVKCAEKIQTKIRKKE